MIFIYTPKITKRVEYIFKLFFKQLLNIEYEITLKPEIFKQYNGVKINYSNQRFEDSLNFQPVDLLFKTGIDSQELKTIVYKGQKVFFPVYDPKSNLPFDPFGRNY
jgi:hypothetical protein